MDYKNIENLIKVMSESNLTELELDGDDIKIKMKKERETFKEIKEDVKPVNNIETKIIYDKSEVNDNENNSKVTSVLSQVTFENTEEYEKVVSPIVGTFYESPSPDADAYVKVGSKIKKGEVIAIIEAMKLMNEIEAEFDMEIVDIVVKNEAMVEYGETIFKVRRV
jgi:acetyl-CoA carboxylase biotin carboxyl carrier protein